MAHDIFISYSHQDRERVKILVEALAAEGWEVFWDRTIPPGESWRTFIGAPLSAAPVVIVCWTKTSIESDWVSQEADAAAKRKALLPVMLDHVSPPLGLGHIHAADLVGWMEDGGGKLPAVMKHAILRKLPGAGATPPAAPHVSEAEPVRHEVRSGLRRAGGGWRDWRNWPLKTIAATLLVAAAAIVGWSFLDERGTPRQHAAGPKEIGTMDQAEMRDAAGKVTVEASTIHVMACGGGSKPDIYVYEYKARRAFRAVQPPNWGTALGGKDFPTFSEAVSAGCAAAPPGGLVLGPPYDGFALGGGDILRYYGSPSESACRADCEREGGNCKAYTWVKPEGYQKGDPPVCYLMASYRNPVRHKCCVTATRGPFPTPP